MKKPKAATVGEKTTKNDRITQIGLCREGE
jgi:hypothetical protein